MADRIKNWKPMARSIGNPINDLMVDKLVKAVRSKPTVPLSIEDLENARVRLLLRGGIRSGAAPPSLVAERLDRISRTIEQLWGQLELDCPYHPNEIPPTLRVLLDAQAETIVSPQGADLNASERIHNSLAGLPLLKQAATRAAERLRSNDPKGPRRHVGNQILQNLFRDIAPIYEVSFRKNAGVSTNLIDDHRGGPFVRFVHSFLEICEGSLFEGDKPTDTDVLKAFGLAQDPRKLGEQIRRWLLNRA